MSSRAIPADVLSEAAEWLMRLTDHPVSDADKQACARWCAQNEDNRMAWERAQRLLGQFEQLPTRLAMPLLTRDTACERRQVLKKLAMLLIAAPAMYGVWRSTPVQDLAADHHTATGQRENLTLPDGSHLVLNTASRINVHFSAGRREVELLSGEMLIDTHQDVHRPPRPFFAITAQGTMQALGTRFSVWQFDDTTRLTVSQGAVKITPHASGAETLIVQAGQQAQFTRTQTGALSPAQPDSDSWVHGMLMADNLRLDEVTARLGRYRRGVLQCDPSVAAVRISGAFPLDNTDLALRMIRQTYGLKMETRTRFWVTLTA